MLNIQVDNGQLQSLDSAKVISVKSGDKIQVSVEPDSNYQVLIADNEADVVLKVTNADGTSFDVVLEGLASLYEAGDVITQLLLDINGEQMVVGNIADLLGALDATAAGGVIGQNRSLAEDNPNIDPNRSAADDSDQLRSDTGAELLGVDGEANERPSVSNVFLVENEILGVEAAGDMNIITGQLTATDPNVADTHTFSIVEGSLSVTDTNGVITLLGDSVTAVVNEDGTYTISGDFNDLSDGEIATVTFDYIATDQGGLSSIPATVSLEITGTNDIPVVEDINLNGELSASWLINASTTPQEIPQGEEGPSLSSYDINGTSIENINALFYNGPGSVTLADLSDVNPYDGSAIKYSFNVNAGETITFSWIFNDAEQPQAYTEYNDTAFVVIDGQQINVLADVDEPGFTSSGLFTYTFPDAGTHEITFGVVNDDDSSVDSNLEVTYVTGGELTGTEIAGYVEALGASAVYFETFDSEDVLGVDDTQDEDTNFFTGLLSVADDDVMNEGLHTFHVVQDEENNNIVTVAGTTVVTADDIAVDIIQNEDGTWSYTIDGDFSALAAGETATVSFQYYADDTRGFDGTDGINESSISEPKTITVTITGTNDQPIVENVVRGVDEIIYENSDQDEEDTNQDGILRNDEGDMTVSGQLSASDEDVNDTHTFAQVEESVQSDNQLIDAEDLTVVVNPDGSYSMTGDFTALAAGETATVTFQYTATDSSSGSEENNTSEPKTVSITITGTNDQPVVEAINASDTLLSGETGQVLTDVQDVTGSGEGSVQYTYFTVYETTTLSISANSLDFDTYLYILRNDGDLTADDHIAHNDDGGPGLNSYIHITLAPGEYIAAVGDYYLGLDEVISGINNENRPGEYTLTFNANHDITIHDTTMNNSVFYETHDATDIPGLDDTQEDVLTSFNSTLATAMDDDVNDTHTYHKLGTETIDNELVTDFNVVVNEDGTYSVSGNFNPLAAGETATVTFYYYADDGRGFDGTDGINESSISEPKAVTLTITGTNDQPIVQNVVMGVDDTIYETHDDEFYQNGVDDTQDDVTTTLTGTLEGIDEDINDTLVFETNNLSVSSEDIDASLITLDGITLTNNSYEDGTPRSADFEITGDFNALAAGETATVTFQYRAVDDSSFQTPGETNSSEPKFVSITVTGTNDQPVVDNVVMGVDENIYESRDNKWYNNGEDDTQDDVTTAVFGKLTAMDDDLNDTHVFNVRDYTASDYYGHGNGGPGQHGDQGDIRFDNVEFFQKGPNNPSHNVKMMIDSTDVQVGEIDVTKLVLMNNNAQDSEVDFKLEGNFNALGVGETATVTFEYIANDKTGYGQSGDANNEPSLSEAKLVTITITGTNDQPVVTANKVYSVSEADGDLIPSVEEEVTVIREAFEVQDDDVNDTHTFSIESIYNLGEIDMAGGYELFGPVTYIDALGNISAVFVQVKLPAGVDAKDISIDSIRVDGGEFEIVGSFDALSGEINGNPADVLDIKLKYFAEDQNGLDGTDGINESSRSETHWMNIQVVGTNDVASLGGDNTGNIHEDDTWTIDGQLTVTDLDAGEEAYQSVVTYDNVNSTNATALGVLIMDPVSGKWSYFLDHANNGAQIQALGDEQIVEKFIVKSIDGTEQTVTITIQGENDAPLITSVTGDDTVITENQVIDGNVTDATVLADVDATDVDSANLTYTITSGNSEGYFEINSDGQVSLTPLGESEIAASHVNDRIFDLGVTVSDGTLEDTTTVTITVDDNFVNIPSVDLPASMDSGASNSDNITNVTLPTWQLANIAPDALNVIITDENSVIQAQAARSSVDGMWVISNAGAGELSFNGVNWFFTPDNALADGVYGYNAIVIDDAGNEASKAFNITIDTTPPVIDSDDIAADINETLSSINLGEIAANELNGPVTFSVSGAGFSIDANNNLIFNGELDYENSSSQTATVTATDAAGNSISQDVTVEVNNVTGIVSLLAGGVALQTFNCCNDEGWTGTGHEDFHPHGVLGWFEDDSDTRSQTFDLDTNAGEDVTINFNLSVYGEREKVGNLYSGYHYVGSGWEGNDTFTVTVTDSNGDTITTEEYSPDGNVNNMAVSFDITVPDDGEFTVEFQSSHTVDSGEQTESWSVDNFEIVGADHQVLTFDSSSEGEIDMAALLDQGNDFEDEGGNSVSTPDSVDDIDLTSGDHILSNLSVEDFIAMTDDDNTLKIKGDSGDEINLDMSQWKVADNDAVDVGNPDAGIDADSDGYVTYTNIDPVGGAAAESLQLLIDENIDVNS
jgi:VCBS repeat-containing protein